MRCVIDKDDNGVRRELLKRVSGGEAKKKRTIGSCKVRLGWVHPLQQ